MERAAPFAARAAACACALAFASCGAHAAAAPDARSQDSAATSTTMSSGIAVGVLVRREPLRVGVRASRASENELAIVGKDAGARAALISGQANEVRVEEILGIGHGETSKLRVTYEKSTTIVLAPADQKGVYASAVDGKSYIVERAGDGGDARVRVTDERGERPKGPEVETVLRDYGDLGRASSVSSAIPSTPLRQGDRVPSLAAAIRARLDERRTAKIDALEARVGETRVVDGARCVVFELAGRMTLAMHANVTFDLRGEYVVRVDDGWETNFELIGAPTSDVATRVEDRMPIAIERAKTRFRFTSSATYTEPQSAPR